jgi:hypothetical protein
MMKASHSEEPCRNIIRNACACSVPVLPSVVVSRVKAGRYGEKIMIRVILLDTNTYQLWDLLLKGATAIFAVIAGTIGLWKYFDTSRKEFRKPYWERQLSLYFEVTAAAATLAIVQGEKLDSSDRERLRTEAQEKFWQLYYGALEIVTDNDVTDAIVEFKECLIKHKAGNATARDMELKSLALARACRKSISKSWSIELSELEGKTR